MKPLNNITRSLYGILHLSVFTLTLMGCGGASSQPVTKGQEVNDLIITPVANLRKDFMYGADVSMIDQIEQAGGKYQDIDGIAKDPFLILKENGVNWIRLRLWHTPINDTNIVVAGKTISRRGDPKGGGNNDLAATIRMAQRAKAMGLNLLLDFHYSDFWADPEKQEKPVAWKNLKGQALEQAVYDYTKQTLVAMANAKAMPDMVQIGNETNGGMLWPDGKTWQSGPNEKVGGYDAFANLLKQGVRAVRESDPNANNDRRIKVALHLANGADNKLYRTMFDELTLRKVDYDLIGLSFYPYWHGTIPDFQANMDDISSRYGKEVVVLETAYAYTTTDGDGFHNLFSATNQAAGGYKATVQGQASLVRDVIDAVAQVPGGRGAGVFYWAPDWIPAKGVGWRTGEGNAWDNQAMFDFKGKALPSLQVFRRVQTNGGPIAKALTQAPLALTAFVGEAWQPPETVKLAFNDDATREVFVEWTPVDDASLKQVGRFVIKGKTIGVEAGEVSAQVNVSVRRNAFLDPGFESGALAEWTITGDADAVKNERNLGNAHSGLHAFHYWKSAPFKFELSKQFSGLSNGRYTFSAWAAGGGGEKSVRLFARNCGNDKNNNAAISNTGWQKWRQYKISGIQVTGGTCTVGVAVDGATGNWGNIDDVEFAAE
jgi:arabinogalactan endo-1,4-beta-galactosidase